MWRRGSTTESAAREPPGKSDTAEACVRQASSGRAVWTGTSEDGSDPRGNEDGLREGRQNAAGQSQVSALRLRGRCITNTARPEGTSLRAAPLVAEIDVTSPLPTSLPFQRGFALAR